MRNLEIEELPIEEVEFCVLDFETTGTAAKSARAIEIGLVKVKNYQITDTYQSFLDSGLHIPYFITNLTGITNDDVYGAPTFEEIIDEINFFIKDTVLVAHNMPFDYAFLKSEYLLANHIIPSNPTLCTLKMARKLYPSLPSKSLGNLTKHFRIRHKNVHRALGDSTVTAKLLMKMMRELQENYAAKTASDLLNFQGTSSSTYQFKHLKKKLAEDIAKVPSLPGVYFFKDDKENIEYIGKAKDLRKRINSYFRGNSVSKARKIVKDSSRLGIVETKSELTALLAEAELIKKHNPPFNTLLKKYSRANFIKSRTTHDYPDLSVSTKFDFDGNDYFGPYNGRETAKTLIEIANKTFALRECKDKEFAKKRLCYLNDIKRCLAPCTEEEVKEEYEIELRKAYDFLEGNNQHAVDRLIGKMKKLSDEKKYEAAAEIRNVINMVLNQINRSSILSEPVNKANVLVVIQAAYDNDFLLLKDGKLIIKDFPLDENDLFMQALEDYYSGSEQLNKELTDKDLERLKISLGWLVKNRTQIKTFYLKDYRTREALLSAASLTIL